jgi:hypothetical protein
LNKAARKLSLYNDCYKWGGAGTAAARRDRAALIFFGPFLHQGKKGRIKRANQRLHESYWDQGKTGSFCPPTPLLSRSRRYFVISFIPT